MTDAAAIVIAGSVAGVFAAIPAIITALRMGKLEKNVNSKMDEALITKGQAEHAKGVIQGRAEEKARRKP